MPKNQSGLAHIAALTVVLVAALTGSFLLVKSHQHQTAKISSSTTAPAISPQAAAQPKNQVSWYRETGGVWAHSGTPPACPAQPILATPIDLSLATSILYPGQVRGTAFKPQGGFRFDNQPNNNITVKVPLDAQLLRGTKGLYTGADEIQYGFEFLNSCGIWYDFAHIHTLSPQFQAYADKLPLITDPHQQQLYDIPGSPQVKAGDIIATQIGIVHTKNVSTELEVQDLRHTNGKTIRPAWSQYADQFDKYGICWLDWLPAADAARAHALPGGDSISGKQSDYCS